MKKLGLLCTLLFFAVVHGQDFPVTIEHQYGSTTISEAPQRVLSLGYTEQDYLLALDVQPIAVRYWYGDETNAIFPWAQEKISGENPPVLNMAFGALNYEAILALEPDLISAVTAGISEEEYELLSQIAPTITQAEGYINFGMPWQEVTTMIGEAVGKSDEAQTLIAEVEDLFADAKNSNPNFVGKNIAVAYYYEEKYGIYTDQDSRARFFTDLGFVVPSELVELAGESFYADISTERLDLLEQDAIAIVNLQFIEGGRETLETQPLFSSLQAVQDGRVVYLDETAENALGFSSPLSLPFALNAVLPQLETMFREE
jgi:iron complex transport system substrate-binding protein